MSSNCKLCGSSSELRESHIIPRAIFRGLKRSSGQLARADTLEASELEIGNADPKEKLLCHNCEQFLSKKYEQYGVRLFKNPRGVVKGDKHIELSNFDYEIFYLYLISILWRASISTLHEYSEVDLPEELEGILRKCINEQSVRLSDTLSIDNFFRVSVYRLIDSTGTLNDKIIKGLLSTFIQTVNEKDETVFYFVTDGFLIKYVYTVGENEFHSQNTTNHGQLEKNKTIKILKAEVTSYPELVDLIRHLTAKVKRKQIRHLKS
jgi:hypothetical protein